MACNVCGMAACGLASHKQMTKAAMAREDLEILAAVVTKQRPGVTRQEVISKTLELHPEEFYEPDMAGELSKADPWDAERRDMFVDVERLADQLQVAHRSLSRAQAVAKALQMRPEVYDKAVLMSAGGPMQRETAG